MRGPGRVAAHQGAAVHGALGQLGEGELEQRHVVGGRVGAGVAGAQDPGQGLAARGLAAEQRVEAEAALVGARGALLVGVRREQRGVDVENHAAGRRGAVPGAGAGRGAGLADLREQLLVEALQAAIGGGVGGHRPEEYPLVAQGAEVAEAVAAVGEQHGQVAHHASGLMAHLARVHAQGRAQALREAQPVGQGAEQHGARARGQVRPLRAHFNAGQRRGSVHLHGDPPERGLRVSSTRIIPAREDL